MDVGNEEGAGLDRVSQVEALSDESRQQLWNEVGPRVRVQTMREVDGELDDKPEIVQRLEEDRRVLSAIYKRGGLNNPLEALRLGLVECISGEDLKGLMKPTGDFNDRKLVQYFDAKRKRENQPPLDPTK